MSEVQPKYNDEIDLFDLFKNLWDGKWFITTFAMIAVLVCSVYIFDKNENSLYESKLIYSIDTIPPFYKKDKVLADFQNFFYSKSIFEEWKKSIGNTSLIFEDFSNTKVFDGIVVAKNESQQLAIFVSEKKGRTFMLVKTNQLDILDDFFKYADHINRILKDEYVVIANNKRKHIESLYKDFFSANNKISPVFFNNLLYIDQFIESAEKGTNLLTIRHPTMPIKTTPISSSMLPMSGVLGGMIGALFVFIRNAIRKRKE